ncbi:hypothetical protein IPH25_02905 [bacterium]|nr:MAG: hypothetical protein IPG37_05045 [bacterium]QQR61416.1 MAG: hypothetical protein IPH25_02905 [bacterium]QQR63063.1 MAG: hypothetical protein IPH67_01130 [bacterium]
MLRKTIYLPYWIHWIICLLLAALGFFLILAALGELIIRFLIAVIGCFLIGFSIRLFTGRAPKEYIYELYWQRNLF